MRLSKLTQTITLGMVFCSLHVLVAGAIRGTVFDASTRKPLSGVNLYFVPERILAASSDEKGNYIIKEVNAGSYRLMASFIGYTIQIKDVAVEQNGAAEMDFQIILSALDVETPIVAASKREQALNEAATSVSVLFAQEVSEADATTLAEPLKNITGLDYTKVDEGHYNITARGFNSSSNSTMLLLIDGRTANTVYSNSINWSGIPISEQEIDRIEVIKGPGAALYGANAYSGVVNIVTKSPRDMAGTTVHVATGGRGTFSTSYTNAGVNENLAYKISGGYFEGDNYKKLAASDTSIKEFKQLEDRLRIAKADARVEYRIDNQTALTLSSGFAKQQGRVFLVGLGRFNTKTENDLYISGKLRHKNFSVQSYYNGSRTDTIKALPRTRDLFLNNDLYNAEMQQTFDWGQSNQLILGGNLRWQRFDSKGTVIPKAEAQTLYGLYGQFETRLLSKLNLILAGRVDHHPTVEFQVSPKAALLYALSDEQVFRLTANQAYINPVFVELFIDLSVPGTGGRIGLRGNRDLDPRKITAFEFGYQGFFRKKFRLSLDYYHYIVEDFISDPIPVNLQAVPLQFSFRNFGKVNQDGVDLGMLYLIAQGLRWSTNFSAMTTDEKEPPLNAPKYKLNSSLYYEYKKGLYGNASVRFVDAFDWDAGQVKDRIDSHFTADLTIGYRVPKEGIRASVTAANLFDKKYRELAGGALLRRKVLGALTMKF